MKTFILSDIADGTPFAVVQAEDQQGLVPLISTALLEEYQGMYDNIDQLEVTHISFPEHVDKIFSDGYSGSEVVKATFNGKADIELYLERTWLYNNSYEHLADTQSVKISFK